MCPTWRCFGVYMSFGKLWKKFWDTLGSFGRIFNGPRYGQDVVEMAQDVTHDAQVHAKMETRWAKMEPRHTKMEPRSTQLLGQGANTEKVWILKAF